MTATEQTSAAAPARSWWTRRALIAECVLVLVLAVAAIFVLQQQAERQSFSVDESRWISTSRYFWITFVERDLLGPAWQPNYLVLTHPPVARYIIGFGLWLQGWSPDELNGRYDTDRSRAFNRQAGNIPSSELLAAARRVVLVFAVGATVLLYPIGRSLAGPVAGAAAVSLALANPLLATLWTRALAESVLAGFTVLAFFLAIRVAGRIDSRPARFVLPYGLGIAVALATATKLSGVLFAAGLALYVVVRQAPRWWAMRSWSGIGPWTDAALAAILTFTAINPLLYPNPVMRTLMLFEHRRAEMEQQALGTPRLAVPDDVGVRAEVMYRRTFLEWGTFQEWLSVPLDVPLVAIGLGVALLATWRTLQRRAPPGPLSLLLCWAVATFGATTVNLGFDSSHYYALPETVVVLLEAVALAALSAGVIRVVRRRPGLRSTVRSAASVRAPT